MMCVRRFDYAFFKTVLVRVWPSSYPQNSHVSDLRHLFRAADQCTSSGTVYRGTCREKAGYLIGRCLQLTLSASSECDFNCVLARPVHHFPAHDQFCHIHQLPHLRQHLKLPSHYVYRSGRRKIFTVGPCPPR